MFEIIVPQHQWIAAAVLICSTGLFLPTRPWEHPPGSNFDQGWRIRNKFAHLSTPGWTMSPSSVAIVPDVRAGICLDIPETCIGEYSVGCFKYSRYLDGLNPRMISDLPWPRLPTLVRSLPWRMGQMDGDFDGDDEGGDDDAVMDREWEMARARERARAREQVCDALADLVDGMDIDPEWASLHLRVEDPTLYEEVRRIIVGRPGRIAESNYTRGPSSSDLEQTEIIRSLPGRD